VPKLKSFLEAKVAKGIVFVPEDAPVLMRIEFGTTASESADYPIPGLMREAVHGCDPCCGCDPSPDFSYESIMEGPDES
jgi:hypothetical protein